MKRPGASSNFSIGASVPSRISSPSSLHPENEERLAGQSRNFPTTAQLLEEATGTTPFPRGVNPAVSVGSAAVRGQRSRNFSLQSAGNYALTLVCRRTRPAQPPRIPDTESPGTLPRCAAKYKEFIKKDEEAAHRCREAVSKT